jgi:hypothetical protein
MEGTLDAARKKQLRQRIDELLEERAADPGFDERARRRWLVDHLADYVPCWRGFAELPMASRTPLTDLPGFDVVSAGIDATSLVFENLSAPDALSAGWTAVRAAMDEAVAHGGKGATARLHDRVVQLQALLQSGRHSDA